MSGATYSSAGVDLELYGQAMARLPAHMRRTQCPRVVSAEGGFAALFRLDFAGLFRRRYSDPLLVSVRSGARVSMPGMMDTVLNLGLNDETVEGLATKSGNPRFAWDAYRRFVQMYGDVVIGVGAEGDHG